jgi:FHA domain-containing protein/cysteine-rich secretory family protein
MAELHIRTGEDEEHTVDLDDLPVTFGRGDTCDFVLSEQRASRQHCTFHPVGNGWRVEDNGSSNGTWLGGKPVLSARLQPGDEIEIGLTVMTYVGQAAQRTEIVRERRPPRPRPVRWGLFVVPAALAGIAWVASSSLGAQGETDARNAWTQTARATVERLAIEHRDDLDARSRALKAFASDLKRDVNARSAYQVVTAEIETLATGGTSPIAPTPTGSAWRTALAQIDAAGSTLTAEERRVRLSRLIARHGDDADALAAVRERLVATATAMREHAADDLSRTDADAEAALAEGRFGNALDLWTAWRLRAAEVSRDRERRLAKWMAEIRDRAGAEAVKAAGRYDELVAEGRDDAASAYLDGVVGRLRGTGHEVWLEVRSGRGRQTPGTVVLETGGRKAPTESASTRQLNRALRALTAADQMGRLKQFTQAAGKLRELAPEIEDATLRGEVEERAEGLEGEAAFTAALLTQIAAQPRRFSPLKLPDGSFRIDGATDTALVLTAPRGKKTQLRALETLPGDAVAHLIGKAEVGDTLYVAAAEVLHDYGSETGYIQWMRAALAVDAIRLIHASRVHARRTGKPLPLEGFMPHPDKKGGVISYDEWEELKNAEKIADYTAQLTKVVEQIESTGQAKGIAKVAKVYAELEKARNHALELIFDTEKYFYPYRDRMAEYAPVSQEVNERVQAVRDVWKNPVSSTPKKGSKIAALQEKAEDLAVEIDLYGGDAGPLMERVARISMYLDRTLTLRTYFEHAGDLELLDYNVDVLKKNAAMDTIAANPERKQVLVTNEYRIMFGHRPAVLINDQLVEAARGHSDDMSRLGFFAHFSPVPGKRTPGDRMKLAKYPAEGGSENIHAGSGSPEGAHNSWITSSGHHRNILTPMWVELGTGQAGRYWTQNFGYRSGFWK